MNTVSNVVQLMGDYVARCPECSECTWELIVDRPGEFNTIEGIRCSFCNMAVKFEMRVVGRKEVVA